MGDLKPSDCEEEDDPAAGAAPIGNRISEVNYFIISVT
jgi:hypothetical protein